MHSFLMRRKAVPSVAVAVMYKKRRAMPWSDEVVAVC